MKKRYFSYPMQSFVQYGVCGQLISLDGFLHHRRCFEEHAYAKQMLNYSLNLLLLEIAKDSMGEHKKEVDCLPEIVITIKAWMKQHYFEAFTVKQLATHFGYKADYLSTLFKRTTGVSIVRYTNELRIKNAKNLLVNFDLSIKEAAYACGFKDEKYFMQIFKRIEGITPTQYRTMFSRKRIN